jgi:threonine dehydrogenase-like Zn-dependent dehydrogenase
MRAVAVFPAERQVRLVSHPEPQILSPAQVLVRVLEVGLCGTDREIATFRHGTPPPEEPYLVPGHEALGQVEEVGSSVHRLQPGQLVVPTVRRPCRSEDCRACRMGRPDFCTSGGFSERGIWGAHGFLAERVVDDVRWLHPVPSELHDVGVLAEPLAIAEAALLELERTQRRLPWAALGEGSGAGRRAVVLGAGPVALLGAMALLVRGYRTTVYSQGARGTRSLFAESLGAEFVSAEEDRFESVARRIGNIDVMLEATGATPMALAALEQLGRNGVYLLTGVPGRRGAITIEAGEVLHNLVERNQVLLGTVNPSAEAFRAAVQDLALFARRWPTVLPSLVASRHDLDEAPELLLQRSSGLKRVVVLRR